MTTQQLLSHARVELGTGFPRRHTLLSGRISASIMVFSETIALVPVVMVIDVVRNHDWLQYHWVMFMVRYKWTFNRGHKSSPFF
jgi:hypothetical protein